jgi:predicted TIM-barrel fold metal-dependent hydrolase
MVGSATARPGFAVPSGARDCHCHVFEPCVHILYVPERNYTPPDEPLEAFLSLLDTLSLARAAIVQPSVYGRDNVLLEMCFPITWGGPWDYPYSKARDLIHELRDRYGADKMGRGSDMPNVERFCTYNQCPDDIRRHCDFLSGDEMERILGGNVRELAGISGPPS